MIIAESGYLKHQRQRKEELQKRITAEEARKLQDKCREERKKVKEEAYTECLGKIYESIRLVAESGEPNPCLILSHDHLIDTHGMKLNDAGIEKVISTLKEDGYTVDTFSKGIPFIRW